MRCCIFIPRSLQIASTPLLSVRTRRKRSSNHVRAISAYRHPYRLLQICHAIIQAALAGLQGVTGASEELAEDRADAGERADGGSERAAQADAAPLRLGEQAHHLGGADVLRVLRQEQPSATLLDEQAHELRE